MSAALSKVEEFLDLYRQLESDIKEVFPEAGNSPIPWLGRRREFRHLSSELDYCREVRNLLSHREKISGSYAVEPSDAMLETLRNVIDHITNPAKAHHIMVGRKQVIAKTTNDLVRPTMAEMLERNFSHIPILKDEKVVGVFSETVLLKCLVEAETLRIDSEMRFRDLEQYLPLESHQGETFRFVGRNTYATDIADMFDEADRSEDLIGMIFITENGKPTERLLGIITAWDIATLSKETRCYAGLARATR
ncbi:MAG: hypothetical protein IKV48_01460 [Eggerthellaceae bacterium]|nr:hypothetical protein [Eggerthellaceae bacterium]